MRTTRDGSLAWRLLTAGCAALGCAPDEVVPAQLDEVCESPSPFRLLELDPARPLAISFQVQQVGDRRLLWLGYLDESETDGDWPPYRDTELWSVGTCGETPVRLDAQATLYPTLEVWPELLLACRDGREIVALDPLGERASHVVFRTDACRATETPWGLVATQHHDDDFGALVLFPYPDDPWTQTSEPRVLLDRIRVRTNPQHVWPGEHAVLEVFDDDAFVLTEANVLTRFSLLDGSITQEAENVDSFAISPDQRWLIWQDATRTADGSDEWPEGAIYLRDRVAGTTTHLVDTALAYTFDASLDVVNQGYVRLHLGGVATQPERFFSIAGPETFDVPPGHWLVGWGADTWLDLGVYGHGPFAVFDLATRALTPIFPHEGELMEFADDRATIWQASAHALLNARFRAEGRLWSVAIDGDRELLAERVREGVLRTASGSVVTVLDLDAKWRGNLVVVDRDSLEEQRIDTRVVRGASSADDGNTLLYGVSDAERTGVWLARLPAG